MNVSSCCSTTDPYPANAFGKFQQQMQDFKGLGGALRSGDISSAQSAFATLQKDLQSAQPNGKTSPLLDENSTVGKDFKALEDALQSGDVKTAQDAFATLKKDIRSAKKAHGHHHHHRVDNDGEANDGESSTAGTTTGSTTSPAPASGTNPTLNVVA
jgi:hypothetical protein